MQYKFFILGRGNYLASRVVSAGEFKPYSNTPSYVRCDFGLGFLNVHSGQFNVLASRGLSW